MRVKIMATLIDDDGYEVGKPVEVETEVPNPNEVRGRERFLKGFHQFEQAVLCARNEAGEKLAGKYMTEVGTEDKKTEGPPESTL